jgi:hypothetical protein
VGVELSGFVTRMLVFSLSLALQPSAMASSFTKFLDQHDTPQSVGLLWMSDKLVAETST